MVTTCKICGTSFQHRIKNDRIVKYCSRECYATSKKGLQPWNKGVPCSEETKNKLSAAFAGIRRSIETEFKKGQFVGKDNVNWIEDRTALSPLRKHTTGQYKDWRKSVCDRDGWKCKLSEESCSNKIQVHHILRWSKYPEHRYSMDNAITLCTNHHPIKESDEKKMAPLFFNLIGTTNWTALV